MGASAPCTKLSVMTVVAVGIPQILTLRTPVYHHSMAVWRYTPYLPLTNILLLGRSGSEAPMYDSVAYLLRLLHDL